MAPNRFNKFKSEKEDTFNTSFEKYDTNDLPKIKNKSFKIPKKTVYWKKPYSYNKLQRTVSSPIFRSEEEYKNNIFCFEICPVSRNKGGAFGANRTSSPILRSPNLSPTKYTTTPVGSPIKHLNTPNFSPIKLLRTPDFSPIKDVEMGYCSEEDEKEEKYCKLTGSKDCCCAEASWSEDEDSDSHFQDSELNRNLNNLQIQPNRHYMEMREVASNLESLSLQQRDYGKPLHELIITLHPSETVETLLPESSAFPSSNLGFVSCSNIYKANLTNYKTI